MTTRALDYQVIANAVELACRAPSLHNSQPWRWTVRGSVVELHADVHRMVRSHDGCGREALISCGVALDHFKIATAAAGWNATVEQFPDEDKPDHIASITFAPLKSVTQDVCDLADAILHRRTDRLPFRAPGDWASFEKELRERIGGEVVSLDVLEDDARPYLAEASRLTESLRRYDDFYHAELAWWTAPFRLSEGVPPSALISRSERQRVPVNRGFPSSGYGDRRTATLQDQARVLVLSTAADTREDAVNCGQALSAVLLTCTRAGFATCPMTHITELESSQAVIRQLTGRKSMPQALIRVGIAPSIETVPAPTPRRSLREVLEIRY
ncbi:Acg family FMN-binding oxidoreductase [Mycolicibacterium tusciae]|uniref:Acg family FMN-binding oxidoreductase n=1 Tax=Mycolicibacterium tusciae TaxID=75922 RepID=UPI00024A2EA4|nr:nitroreductase family protein [Mycolicibacterium tusciae]